MSCFLRLSRSIPPQAASARCWAPANSWFVVTRFLPVCIALYRPQAVTCYLLDARIREVAQQTRELLRTVELIAASLSNAGVRSLTTLFVGVLGGLVVLGW